MTDTMLKKILDAIIQNIWLQVLVLILALSGLTLLIGASFEEVAPTSKGISVSSGSEPEEVSTCISMRKDWKLLNINWLSQNCL